MRSVLPLLAGLVLLTACEARIGKDDTAAGDGKPQGSASASSGTGGASAGTQSKEGELSIDAPGFQMKLDIPKALSDRAGVDSDSGILYPGSSLGGLHVQARGQGSEDQVELRFTTADAPDKVLAWYRDPARASDFTLASANRSGAGYAVRGTEKGDGDPFDLSLNPRSGGGTEGILKLRDRS